MDRFLSCDWGTSSFRLRLVERGELINEIKSEKGISVVFNEWRNEQHSDRVAFYQSYLLQQVKALEVNARTSLQELPILLSGMASSSIGMIELPYKVLPCKADGSDLEIKKVEASKLFPHLLIIISGLKTERDVLRGEETLLSGAISSTNNNKVFIFPGTHSKHIFVQDGQAKDFKTYMTGEFFQLLSDNSIVANSIERNEYVKEKHEGIFSEAVLRGSSINLLNAVFHVRTNQLFNLKSKEANFHYLSGLLLGAELKELKQEASSITLVCGQSIKEQYTTALEALGLHKHLIYKNDTIALIEGQRKICQHFLD